MMHSTFKHNRILFIVLLVFVFSGQIIFWLNSSLYTREMYMGQIYATTSVRHDTSDLHKLNESAHYFGQTIMGWTKFPSFLQSLITTAKLPSDTQFNAHMQERQNMIYTITSVNPLSKEQLEKTLAFLQSKIDEYNKNSNTSFGISNADYELTSNKRSYLSGVFLVLITSILLPIGGYSFYRLFNN